ncbi:MAG: alkaline phosphatase family protein [Verrucomicrobia bacterium]|nr:alkaline phosphatase family protein [Verrucomicrobiota bacterium]
MKNTFLAAALAGLGAFTLFCGRCALAAPGERGKAEHVVIMVWDGMRPDFVTDDTTPTLAALARGGVIFNRHHSVYPTMTEVNGAALSTGCYPNRNGITGNREYRPKLDPRKPLAMEALATIQKDDALTGGRHLGVPTLPELLHAAGERTAVAGTKPVAAFWDRGQDVAKRAGSVTLFAGETLPASARQEIDDALGLPFPPTITFPNTEADVWTTRALTEVLWKNGVPKLSVLWMSDPDYSQHQVGPGQPVALAALKSVDGCLRHVLEALAAKGLREKTDVFVVSDHGFSTITRGIDIVDLLVKAGLPVVREFSGDAPTPGQILVNGLGGSVGFYVSGHDAAVTAKLVETLQASDYAGVIFTRDGKLPGTFALSEARLDSADAPDVLVGLRWDETVSAAGTRGGIVSDGTRKPGTGTHATLAPSDVHNTLIAAGPDFRAGWKDELPSGNVDVAPTAAWILGVAQPSPAMDGRVLREALVDGGAAAAASASTSEAKAENPADGWRQSLQRTKFGDATYLDSGSSGH